VVSLTLRGLISKAADWHCRTRGSSCVNVHTLRVMRGTVGSLSFVGIAHMLIKCSLTIGNAIRFGCGLFGQLLLDLLVGLGLRDDVGQELQVLYASNCVCCTRVSGMTQVQEVRGLYTPTSRY